MISEELRNKIRPHLLECLMDEDKGKAEEMLDECYKMVENGVNSIVVSSKPFGRDLTMKFDEETGEFIGLENMPYAMEYGELL